MKSDKLSVIASLFLSVFFIVILVLVLIGVLKINEYDLFAAATIFACINSIVIATVIGMGKSVFKSIGIGSYALICIVTVLYSAGQFTWLAINFTDNGILRYVITQMIILFVYCLIVLPIAIVGVRQKEEYPKDVVI